MVELLEYARESTRRGRGSSHWPLKMRGFFVRGDGDGAIRPKENRTKVAAGLGGRARLRDAQSPAGRAGRTALVPARDAAVSVGDVAHGPRPELHDGRRRPPLPSAEGTEGPAAYGLRFLRASRGERGDQRGGPPTGDHRAQHRRNPGADEAPGLGDRLAARSLGA